MGSINAIDWLTFAGVSLGAAVAAFWISRWLAGFVAPGAARGTMSPLEAPRSYVFRDGYLISTLDEDEYFIADPADRVGAWGGLVEGVAPLHPDLPTAMAALRSRGEGFLLVGHAGRDAISVAGAVQGDRIVVTVSTALEDRARQVLHRDSLEGFQTEMRDMRAALDHLPVAVWKENADRTITWANGAYFRLLERCAALKGPMVWPIARLFADQTEPMLDAGVLRRCQVAFADGDAESGWFDVSMTHVEDGTLYTARPIDQVVNAEQALRNFVQTLSKTFAHLPIGLAIFDKRRELMLFNPALLSLSTLDPEWLSARPSLFAFLDQLRERQRMPEPKNYKAWRAGLAALEQAAQDGSYQELWTLPTGQTWRVIGRPHPDGAVAFMFEDISSEVSLTRQFRADLDLYQAILDEGEMALAVFSQDGQLVLSNAAYAALWDHDPREMLGMMSLTEATRLWQGRARPSPVWGEVRAFAGQVAERAAWSDTVDLADGRRIDLRVAPLKGGAMLVTFGAAQGDMPLPAAGVAPVPEAVAQVD